MASLMTPRADALAGVHDMSMDELRREYISLKSTGYSLSVEEAHLKDKIEVLREESVRVELNAEVKEEQMSNQLFRRLDGAEKEVQRYKMMLKEEESEAEALTARIKKMLDEKSEVENVLEERQEYLLMNLQRKLLETARKKTAVERELMLERQRYLDVLATRLDALRGKSTAGSAESSTTLRPASDVPTGALSRSNSATATAAATGEGGSRSGARESSVLAVENAAAAAPAPTSAAASVSISEKTTLNDNVTPAPPPKSPFGSFTRIPAKDAKLSGTQHATTITPSTRVSHSGTPRSCDLTPLSSQSSETHHAVVALERKLNQLLLEQAAAMQRTSDTEKQCAALGAKLRSVQEATFLDRARAAKLKEELNEVRARLVEANTTSSTANMSTLGNTSFDESLSSGVSPRFLDSRVSLTMNNLSLRERTRELLSSIPPPPMN